jgi:hypothetical protein
VLQIKLQHRETWKDGEGDDTSQINALNAAGIVPTVFPATDAKKANSDDMRKVCPLESDPDTKDFCQAHQKAGEGCKSTVEQAIADSHRRALLAAQEREDSEWTLIMEDDAVPVWPERWQQEFQRAWRKLPPQYKMVRLGWCTFEEDLGPIRKTSDVPDGDTDLFHLYNWMSWTDETNQDHYYAGGCTTAYMVHKSVIPELLSIYPCCCPMDCCMERGFFYRTTDRPNLYRAQQIVTNMDTNDTRNYAHLFTFFNQSGVMVQDNRHVRSSRPEWNHA